MEQQFLFCPRCGNSNRLEARFCIRCGTKIGLPCNVCGHMNHADASYCLICGTRLKDQKPLDKAIGQFKKRASWQSMMVTVQAVNEYTLHYIIGELRRLVLPPIWFQYASQETSILSLLKCVCDNHEIRQIVSDKARKTADRITKLLSKNTDITFDEMRSLFHEYLSGIAGFSILLYIPYIPLSYSAWQFARDLAHIVRGAPVPWLIITQSVLLPLYLGDSRLLESFTEEIEPLAVFNRDRFSTHQLVRATGINLYDFSSDIFLHKEGQVSLSDNQMLIYLDDSAKGYIFACFSPRLSIQINVHGSSSETHPISKWKDKIPEWKNISKKTWEKFQEISGKDVKAFTMRVYEAEEDSLSLWSHFAYIPCGSIAYLQIRDSHYFLIV